MKFVSKDPIEIEEHYSGDGLAPNWCQGIIWTIGETDLWFGIIRPPWVISRWAMEMQRKVKWREHLGCNFYFKYVLAVEMLKFYKEPLIFDG